MIEAKFFDIIEKIKQEIAVAAIENPFLPPEKIIFQAGIYAGLNQAIGILQTLLNDEDNRN